MDHQISVTNDSSPLKMNILSLITLHHVHDFRSLNTKGHSEECTASKKMLNYHECVIVVHMLYYIFSWGRNHIEILRDRLTVFTTSHDFQNSLFYFIILSTDLFILFFEKMFCQLNNCHVVKLQYNFIMAQLTNASCVKNEPKFN